MARARVVRLEDVRRGTSFVHFDREELKQLLGAYTRRVARGEWRDYGIDHGTGLARFSVYRHTADRPLFTVAKLAPGSNARGDYLLTSAGC